MGEKGRDRKLGSRDKILDDMAVNIGKPEIAAL
jgi:hypothetical protein